MMRGGGLFTISLLHFSAADENTDEAGHSFNTISRLCPWPALSESGRHHPAFGYWDFNAPELPAGREAR
jgi:hypothetical protein